MDSTTFLMPYATEVVILDPAPRRADVSKNQPNLVPSQPNAKSIPGSSSAAPKVPQGNQCPDVIQEYHFSYRIFVIEDAGATTLYTLAVPLSGAKPGYQAGCARLSVHQQSEPDAHNGRHIWDVCALKEGLQPIPAPDEGPNFGRPGVYLVSAWEAELRADGSFKAQRSLKNSRDASARLGPLFQIFGVQNDFVMLEIKLAVKRRFSRKNWNYFSNERALQPKTALLEKAERTGDLILLGEEGVEVPAHSAVLVEIPYFEAKLRGEWSGNTAWNLHNKLRLELPATVTKGAIVAFLDYVYGDTRSVFRIEPTSGRLLQDILSLADACGVPALCADVIQMVLVTSANMDSWLAWLLKEHGVDASAIKKQVVKPRLQASRENKQDIIDTTL
ncbi:hypothetical protein KFL_000470260 [Klebsormidium nitens]|uniref:BTB domain-containing protein n=1 Tax=Klebsormidium nitens TaxID=105231 RepID=A0A1Y1HQ02_KLENI|nr:hypothetical protein KFL_000470260 [Klebsormidium nitens]|eukprot:GAQ80153.1 hypothetical protein KFL_000470260 [Klebsormidium nitens]